MFADFKMQHFLFLVQIIVYAGAIITVIYFDVLNIKEEDLPPQNQQNIN